MFNALIVDKNTSDNTTHASVQQLNCDQLPDGNVLVAVEYSTLNYKDGLCIGPGAGFVQSYPHVPGIDFAGTVETSSDPRFKPGDKVVLTGWKVGEIHWGGYSQKARVNADWLIKLPQGLTTRQAMAVGTAGLTAMLAIMALEEHGLQPDQGPVLVTGAAGGVGSAAVAILSSTGYQVTAVTGRKETSEYLRQLGASELISRSALDNTSDQPLEDETWAACIDSVGSQMLARILGQMKYASSVAAIGLAGGTGLPASIIPFLLRGINLLGIDSVMQNYENRVEAWKRIAQQLPMEKLNLMTNPKVASLADLPQLGNDILNGKIQGRMLVDVNA